MINLFRPSRVAKATPMMNAIPQTSEMVEVRVNLVKVFFATKAEKRDRLGEEVTAWLSAHPTVITLRTVVLLSSDSGFHCLSIVLLGHETGTP